MATNIFLGYPPENIKQFIIENYGPKEDPMLKVPLHFVAEESNATMRFYIENGTYETSPTGEEGSWSPYKSGDTITLANIGDKVYFRAGSDEGNETCCRWNEQYYESWFSIKNGKIAAKGNIQSLLDRKMERMRVPNYCYYRLFQHCTSLIQAPVLPSTTLASGCYSYMFESCTALTQAPILPATTLAESCYSYMFNNCTSLPEPKYNMSHMTFDQVVDAIQNDYIFGYWYSGDPIQIQCSDKILFATYDDNEGQWTITEG